MIERWAKWLGCGVVALACGCAQAGPGPGSGEYVQKLEGTDVAFKMLPIPAGTFLRGARRPSRGETQMRAARRGVRWASFFMEEHEVTWAEYNLFLQNYNRLSMQPPVSIPIDQLADAVTFPTPMYDVEAGPELQRMGGRGPTFPAVMISQFAARQYTKWLSKKTGKFYRLPSEAEWEYAARAGTQTAYSFGDDASKLGDYAWFKDNSNEPDGQTGYHPVMTKKPNSWGLYDMYGNAMEWCVDLFEADASTKNARNEVNWAGITRTPYPRVLRGGGFDSDAAQCRSAARVGSDKRMNAVDPQIPKSPHWMSDGFYIGFRVVSPVKEPTEAEKRKWWEADDEMTIKTIQRDRERRAVVSPGKIDR